MNDNRRYAIKYLNMAKGQIEGILKMIEEDRYCIDISNQILASEALMRKANVEILHGHLKTCVKDAMVSGDGVEEKLEEAASYFDKDDEIICRCAQKGGFYDKRNLSNRRHALRCLCGGS